MRRWRWVGLALALVAGGGAWLLHRLPDLVGDRVQAALAARGVQATWGELTLDGPRQISLIGVQGVARGVRFRAARVTATVDLWRRRPTGVWVDGLRLSQAPQRQAGRAPASAAPRARRRRLLFPVVLRDTAAAFTVGPAHGQAQIREARLEGDTLSARGVRAEVVHPRATLTVQDQPVTASLATRRVEVGAVTVGAPFDQVVRQAWVQLSPGALSAGGQALGGELSATLVGPPRAPTLVEARGQGVALDALAQLAARHGQRLPVAADGAVDFELTALAPLSDAPVVSAQGALRAQVSHPRLGPAPVDVSVTGRAVAARDPVTGAVDAQLHLARGAAMAHLDLRADAWDRAATLQLTATLDPLPCQAAYAALPQGLLGPFGAAALEGTFAPWISLRLPLADPRRLRFRWAGVQGACPIAALNAARPAQAKTPRGDLRDVSWLLHPFTRQVPEATRPVTVGPGHRSYVPLARLPAYVPAVMYLSEDPAFFKHGGVSGHLIQRALMLDLAEGRYVYGGSTLPQQLVKNLFLARTKTLARKLQEALLAARVADVVPKRRILELYLNCIEFGPNVYGIERAARHYFGVSAAQLTPKQAVFLATAKPSPRYADQLRRRGATPDTAHYRTYMRRLFARLVKAGALTPAQVEAARPFQITW